MWRLGVLVSVAACGRFGFDATPALDASVDAPDARDAAMIDGTPSGLIDLDGGASWGGWTMVADSQTTGVWVAGATDRTYTIYRTSFILDPAQTVTAPTLASTDPGDGVGITGDTGDLFDGNWQAGDRIVGLGVALTGTTKISRLFFQVDYDGDSISPASSFGAADGVVTFDAGDSTSYFTAEIGTDTRYREWQYAVFTAFSADGSNNFTIVYGSPPPVPPAGPSRSYVVLAPGDTQLATSGQFLQDIDAIDRIGTGANGQGTCGPATRLAFQEVDFLVAMEASTQIVSFPNCL